MSFNPEKAKSDRCFRTHRKMWPPQNQPFTGLTKESCSTTTMLSSLHWSYKESHCSIKHHDIASPDLVNMYCKQHNPNQRYGGVRPKRLLTYNFTEFSGFWALSTP